jgi:hypothetical protein
MLIGRLEEDPQRVSFVLTSTSNVAKLLTMLKTTHSAVHIETMLVRLLCLRFVLATDCLCCAFQPLLLRMVTRSQKFYHCLASNAAFIDLLKSS